MKHGQLIQLHPRRGATELSDEGLAAACATGDQASQGLLFERHVDAVHRFVARMCGADRAIADDLVQATFIAAFRNVGQFRGGKLQSWLFGIAANVVRGHIRREVARRRVTLSLVEQRVEERASPHDADVAKLRAAIARLPPKLREVLVLVDLQGERGSDAAVSLRIPEGTVWRRLSEARQRLRKALAERP